jgi:hypothetical protein
VNAFAKTTLYLLFSSVLAVPLRCPGQQIEQLDVDSKSGWTALREHWKVCRFGGEGDVNIEPHLITVGCGQPLTGVLWDQDIKTPKDNNPPSPTSPLVRDLYELRLVARRTAGFDFFCGLTFPIADSHATLVLGGWGGGITGLSCVDRLDASENETTLFKHYENQRWYRIRVRVDSRHVQCWVDDESVVKVSRQDHKFSLRSEMDLYEPLGIAAYDCDAQYKDIAIRKLSELELQPSQQNTPPNE